jgi:hypothetical protein
VKAGAAPAGAGEGRRALRLFVVVEVLAVMAVPVVALIGFKVLLDSRAGTFVTGPGPGDPGYQALVEPTPVLAVVERLGGEVTGVTLVARAGRSADGGAVIVVPAELAVEGRSLRQWGHAGDDAAAQALGRALRLRVDHHVTLDGDGWAALLGERTVAVTNPDPVVDGGVERFPAGTVELGAADAAEWLGRLGTQQPAALAFRRSLFWRALLADPDLVATGGGEPAATLAALAAGPHVVELLPVVGAGPVLALDPDQAEELVVEVVPFPSGARPGDRLRVKVLDRTGHADLVAVARQVARAGGEIVIVGNAGVFDGGPTEAVIADPALGDDVRRLLERLGTGTVRPSPGSDETVDVTVLAGPELVASAGRHPSEE